MKSMCPDCGKTTVPKRTGTTFCTDCRKCYVCGDRGAKESSRNTRWPGKWCGSCLQRWHRHGDPTIRKRLYGATVEDRFWFHVGPPDPVTGCREWRAARNPKGYGEFRFSDTQRAMGAHRVALILATGTEPKGAQALHRCDNPACVEPTHLRWGTNGDNMADRLEREGYLTCKRLTENQVIKIKELLTDRSMSRRAIAQRYGVHRTSIDNIANGRTWSYL